MPLRVLFLLLSFVIVTNLVLMLLSAILNKNLYKTHGKLIANCYGIFILILIILYVSLSIAGIK
jgi:hypothetical protein